VPPDYAEQMLRTAEELLKSGGKNLASYHRAVSTAYYAVFHSLQFFIARSLLGETVQENSIEFEEVFRLLGHDVFKEKPSYFAAVESDLEIKKIFENCFILKGARINADYRVPSLVGMSFEDCKAKVGLARETVALIRKVKRQPDKMRLLTASLLIKKTTR
jgi:CRISPR/Cas system CMR-associated protein Cmr3 (group 5 of RAMP superfamily)